MWVTPAIGLLLCAFFGIVQSEEREERSVAKPDNDDMITMQFYGPDGDVTQFVDFRDKVEALRVVIPTSNGDQKFCFVTDLDHAQFISPITKEMFRKKYPNMGTKSDENADWVNVDWAQDVLRLVAPLAVQFCQPAEDRVYMRVDELIHWSRRSGSGVTVPPVTFPLCNNASSSKDKCFCKRRICLEYLCPKNCSEFKNVKRAVDYDKPHQSNELSENYWHPDAEDKNRPVCEEKMCTYNRKLGDNRSSGAYICGVTYCKTDHDANSKGYICGTKSCDDCINGDCVDAICKIEYCKSPHTRRMYDDTETPDRKKRYCGTTMCHGCHGKKFTSKSKVECKSYGKSRAAYHGPAEISIFFMVLAYIVLFLYCPPCWNVCNSLRRKCIVRNENKNDDMSSFIVL